VWSGGSRHQIYRGIRFFLGTLYWILMWSATLYMFGLIDICIIIFVIILFFLQLSLFYCTFDLVWTYQYWYNVLFYFFIIVYIYNYITYKSVKKIKLWIIKKIGYRIHNSNKTPKISETTLKESNKTSKQLIHLNNALENLTSYSKEKRSTTRWKKKKTSRPLIHQKYRDRASHLNKF
jgi:hypothetical protein